MGRLSDHGDEERKDRGPNHCKDSTEERTHQLLVLFWFSLIWKIA
jgi:hypothetical protein